MSRNGTLFRFGTDDSEGIADYDEYVQESDVKDIHAITRPSGACVDCKSVKVRCEFVPGERKCRRCQAKNLPCTPRERKKRKPADTHEQLQEKAHEKDIQIQNLLRQFDQLKTDQKIRHWVEKANVNEAGHELGHSQPRVQALKWDYKGKGPEAAAISFFRAPTHHVRPPLIIKHCNLYPEEIQELFSLYFARINPFFSVLDPELHTAENLIWCCPFLFTVMCAVASRYYVSRPDVYPLAMDFARDIAGQMLVEGNQSIDVCQAYLIMAVYPTPRKRWTEDRSWLLMGVAIRMAMELGLNQPPPPTCNDRQKLNRIRTWLNCYCVDGSHAIQFGKMPMVRLDDFVARTSQDWYKSSSMNTAFDVHLCAYVQMLISVAKWRKTLNAFEKGQVPEGFDMIAASLETEEKLSRELDGWVAAYKEEYTFMPLPICSYRSNTSQLITAYLRLVVLAAAFQHALKRGMSRQCGIFKRALEAAKMVISIMVERLYPTGHLRFAMEANFLYVAYAAAFLANLLRPKFLPLLDERQQREIIFLVTRLIEVLSSRDVALDGRHTPALYSRFLSSLMERHNAKTMRLSQKSSELSTYPGQYGSDRPFTPPHLSSWPDTSFINTTSPTFVPDFTDGLIFQRTGEAEMDFSLNHFVRTVSQDFPSPPFSSPESMNLDMQSMIPAPQSWPTVGQSQTPHW
ncbi:hypothetical protein P691DRAFT_801540 [Macrolepiota fuliginosa MF-IS2]|uniref:Zn(2)-C6 fungal-type domain-containing protein n=1 Tax=Macrolepiota fuliginosa MF-IS2 TaxID=1400762 RepID=A0A9P5XPA1_9AGAR|nr:hypothetical protein P691DRAFT_801540 [Macrolepiota fuliginosa MF-IS2]